MPEMVGIFGSKGDVPAAVDEVYGFGYGETEIDLFDRQINAAAALEPVATTGRSE